MSTSSSDPAAAAPGLPQLGGQTRATIESSLERLLASDVFRRSERHRRFVRHIVQVALDGRPELLKEVLLGIELFGRKLPDYDPRQDPVVRVEAGRVREKLARYYRDVGSAEPFVFEIPVGSYVPRFQRRVAQVVDREIESYAVLPFAHGGGGDDGAFAVGLADQLINLLGRVPAFKVIARVSAQKAHERQLKIGEIGRLLNVTRVVDGSVQRQGARLRCIAHIYGARDGVALWSQSFDSSPGDDGEIDLFAFQDRIADAVLAAASPSSVVRPSTHSDVPAPRRRQARDLIARASYLARRYDTTATDKVIELFEEAVRLDPDNAAGHGALAVAYLHKTTLQNAPGIRMLPKIEAALQRALLLDPTDGSAIALRAMVAFRFRFDWPRAEMLFGKALRLSPHTSDINYRFAFSLIMNGRFVEGMQHARLAVDLDPLNLGLRAHAVQLLAFSRRYDEAEAGARELLEVEPDHLYMNYVLASIHYCRGKVDEGIARFDAIAARHPSHPSGPLGRIVGLGLRGDREAGRRALDAMLDALGDRYCPPFNLAKAQIAIGDRRSGYATLERSAAEADASFCSLPIDPVFAPCHDDPAFIDLLARHGLRAPVR